MWLDVFQHSIIALDRKLCSHLCFVFLFSVCCPYNGLFAIPLILVIVAHVLFNYAAFGCRTFQYEIEGFTLYILASGLMKMKMRSAKVLTTS